MTFDTSNSLIELLKKQLGLNENVFAVMQIWEKELGPLAQAARIEAFKNGQLIVEVASSAHFQELNLRRRELIKQINQHFGNARVIKGIKLKLKLKK
jgi:hypothetical protein